MDWLTDLISSIFIAVLERHGPSLAFSLLANIALLGLFWDAVKKLMEQKNEERDENFERLISLVEKSQEALTQCQERGGDLMERLGRSQEALAQCEKHGRILMERLIQSH